MFVMYHMQGIFFKYFTLQSDFCVKKLRKNDIFYTSCYLSGTDFSFYVSE